MQGRGRNTVTGLTETVFENHLCGYRLRINEGLNYDVPTIPAVRHPSPVCVATLRYSVTRFNKNVFDNLIWLI